MPLSLNEIRARAISFSNEWRDERRERAESQTFWNEFFDIFGVSRRKVASFDQSVRMLGDAYGFIDLFWKGYLVVEHKSRGENLDKAYSQSLDYFQGLRDDELPKYVIVSDFARFRIYDLDDGTINEFALEDLAQNIHLFDFISGYTRRIYRDEDPVNLKAAKLMGNLHYALKDSGYTGHSLELFLVRLMFCFFADDTGIFERGHFTWYIENKTNIDGSDLGSHIASIFQILNTPERNRQTNLDEDLASFVYINGSLFEEVLPIPFFDSKMRGLLLECCNFDWSKVSPAIFGSLFQSVMEPRERRDLGAHYTSEKNILKTINLLFLDDLRADFQSHMRNKRYLEQLLNRIGRLKIFDPACGCGTFLIISYRELRRLEVEIHRQIRRLEGTLEQQVLDIEIFNRDINVDSMYGIEILEFPVRIAHVALWLVDHQINIEIMNEFGIYYTRLPLSRTPNIIQGNALRLNWEELIPKSDDVVIIGNPPYVGKKKRSAEQNEDMRLICGHIQGFGTLDYVACWYVKAADYITNTRIKVGFVSTNSITQGEQAGILGDYLLNHKGIIIHFAHRTFKWLNEASRAAQVYVVIIGFSAFDVDRKYLFDYVTPQSDPMVRKVENINAYLVDQDNLIITNKSRPICDVPRIAFGSMPNDGGHLLFTDEEKEQFLLDEPDAARFVLPLVSAREFIHGEKRWCLWLKDANPSELRGLREVQKRINGVREYRLRSQRLATQRLAETPALFGEIRQPSSKYILIPLHSSEYRKYIPIAFLPPNYIANNSCSVIENATLYHFGVLTSSMHMAWVRQVCGRIKSDFRYSNKLVYNNFPWPRNPSSEQKQKVIERAKIVLDVRDEYAQNSLADLYDPNFMPQRLLTAHRKLDRVVDRCYRRNAFNSDLERVKFLFELYKCEIS